ncbi:MAG: PD40 domain-containing protein, partial [Bacteroidales bacterium]|nr:PD40 domain-containing protein [Bacteroidales bacterium]
MKIKNLIIASLTLICQNTFSQVYPTFGSEIKVNITGLTFDAMEPFISPDGNTLFFNSLNSGGNTNLYYATKVNDSLFAYAGLVNGTYDPSPSHLDAVASLDSLNNFFWTSLRDYPTPMENLHLGIYSSGNVSSITRVYGDFNIYDFNYPFGWLIMDAAINHQGDLLYFCNAKFDFSNTACVGAPCDSKIGVAQKVNDSTFNKLPQSNAIFSNVNDTINYIIYAPQVTKDGLELYYTRLLKSSFNTEICVSVRNSTTDTFSLPKVIHSNLGFLPEAASPSTDKQKIYYHQKDGTGKYHIYLRYKNLTTDIDE